MKIYLPCLLALILVISYCQAENLQGQGIRSAATGGSCKWVRELKKCFDPTSRCSGDKCCKTTGRILPNKLPQCVCGSQPCESCSYTGNQKQCFDSKGRCGGSSCCRAFDFAGSTEFECKCLSDCPVPSFADTCTWNVNIKKCHDPNFKCKGDNCCRPTGETNSEGLPECSCSGSFKAGTCDSCRWSTSSNQCIYEASPLTVLCSSGSCCGLVPINGTSDSECQCQKSCSATPKVDSCKWNAARGKCEDLTGNCSSGGKCCYPTGKIFQGVPQCLCVGQKARGECNNCFSNPNDPVKSAPWGKCQKISDTCLRLYFVDSRNDSTRKANPFFTYVCENQRDNYVRCQTDKQNATVCITSRGKQYPGFFCPDVCTKNNMCETYQTPSGSTGCKLYTFWV